MADFTEKQKQFMARAIQLAHDNIGVHGGPFGAVIVKDGEIVAEAGNSVVTTHDPTAHAEVNAIRKACATLETHDLEGCEIYSSCEPCPMCLSAIYWARLDRLYFAASKYDAENAGFRDKFIYDEINLEIDDRNLKTVQINLDNATAPFQRWDDFENREDY